MRKLTPSNGIHNKGFIEDGDFREQSDALASQRKKLTDQRTQASMAARLWKPWTSCGNCRTHWPLYRRSPGSLTSVCSTS